MRPGASLPKDGGAEGRDWFPARALVLFVHAWRLSLPDRVGNISEMPPPDYTPPRDNAIGDRRARRAPEFLSSSGGAGGRGDGRGTGTGHEMGAESEGEGAGQDSSEDEGERERKKKMKKSAAPRLPASPKRFRVARKTRKRNPWRQSRAGKNVKVEEKARVERVTLRDKEEMWAMTEFLGHGWNVGVGGQKLRAASGSNITTLAPQTGWGINAIVGESEGAEDGGVTLSWDPASAVLSVAFVSSFFKDPRQFKRRMKELELPW